MMHFSIDLNNLINISIQRVNKQQSLCPLTLLYFYMCCFFPLKCPSLVQTCHMACSPPQNSHRTLKEAFLLSQHLSWYLEFCNCYHLNQKLIQGKALYLIFVATNPNIQKIKILSILLNCFVKFSSPEQDFSICILKNRYFPELP